MTEPTLKAVLDELVPPFTAAPRRWEDVLARAESRGDRRDWRRVSVVAVAALLLAAPATVGATVLFREFPRPSDVRDEPVPVSPRETVAAGRVDDVRWRLVAFRSDRGLCVGLDFAGAVQSSSASCGVHRLAGLVGQPSVDYIGRAANRTWLSGLAAKRVDQVVVVLAGGRRVGARTYAGPRSLALPFDFYVATVPGRLASADGNARVRLLIALDERGEVIGRHTP